MFTPGNFFRPDFKYYLKKIGRKNQRKSAYFSQDACDRMFLVGIGVLAYLLISLWMSHTEAFQLAGVLWPVMYSN